MSESKLEKWGEGPWVAEPDRVEFYAHGLPCLMRRIVLGSWCGYVAVPQGHPLHGAGHNDERLNDIYAHGGITYAEACSGELCHQAKPGESEDVWWFGFDCAHAGDYVPQMGDWRKWGRDALSPDVRGISEEYEWLMEKFPEHGLRDVYRDEAYVRARCEELAAQLSAAGR